MSAPLMKHETPRKVFWENPYLTELETTVKSVEADIITLHETIFYAFSGGQESDHGTIGTYPVLEAKKAHKEIFYKLPDNHELKAGNRVKVMINWDRRYKLMRLHFAAELVLELVYKKFSGVAKVGAHIAADKARIDFELNQPISPFIPTLQEEAQNIIDSNREVISTFSDEVNERRYWKIDGFSQVPCGGTHIKQTHEIGKIRLKRVNPGKGRERIEIYLNS